MIAEPTTELITQATTDPFVDRRNWAGNYHYRAARLHCPQTVAEVQELAARSLRLRALGSRHSFNSIADTSDDLVSTERLDKVIGLDRERGTVTVEGGIRYGQLCRWLDAQGFALHNLASLPHISVAGACATGTHGSGDRNGNLATAVRGLEIVTASGDILTLDPIRDGDTFRGAVVSLGALGIVTKLTLDILPTFAIRQDVYENLPLSVLEANFDAITSGAYSVSLFTDWRDAAFTQIWRKRRVTPNNPDAATLAAHTDGLTTPDAQWFRATLATHSLHPIAGVSAENCTTQGVVGPWYDRLPHFRMEYTPSSGEELQTEYLVPRSHALAALNAVADLREHIAPLLLISEIRTIAGDNLWLSPCCGQDCVGIHFTWKPDWPAVQQLLPRIEAALAPFDARPHWGKLFTTPPAVLQSLYPRLPDFKELTHACDPTGKFRNAFLDNTLFAAS